MEPERQGAESSGSTHRPHTDVSGGEEFLRQKSWPVLSGVAEWIATRAAKTRRGYGVRASMGIVRGQKMVRKGNIARNSNAVNVWNPSLIDPDFAPLVLEDGLSA
jgi:hypothetical protein